MARNSVHPKVKAVGVAGLVVTLVVLVAAQLGYTVDPAVQALIATVVTILAGYFAPAAPAA